MDEYHRNIIISRVDEIELLHRMQYYIPMRFGSDPQLMALWKTMIVPKLNVVLEQTLEMVIGEYQDVKSKEK